MYPTTGLPGWAHHDGFAPFCLYPSSDSEPDPDIEEQALKNQADTLQVQLDLVKKRLSGLKTGTAAE